MLQINILIDQKKKGVNSKSKHFPASLGFLLLPDKITIGLEGGGDFILLMTHSYSFLMIGMIPGEELRNFYLMFWLMFNFCGFTIFMFPSPMVNEMFLLFNPGENWRGYLREMFISEAVTLYSLLSLIGLLWHTYMM